MKDILNLFKEFLLLFAAIIFAIVILHFVAPEIAMRLIEFFLDHSTIILVIICAYLLLQQTINAILKYKMKQLDK